MSNIFLIGKIILEVIFLVFCLLILGIASIGLCGPFGIIVFCLVSLLAYWVYKDADKRNSSCSALWAGLTLLCALIFFPAYLVFRPEMPEKKSTRVIKHSVELCPDCGKYFQAPATFCPNCGAALTRKNSEKGKQKNLNL